MDEHCRWIPAEPLRRYVAWYTGYRQRGVPPARHRGLPSPYLTLIFTLDEPLTIEAHPDPGQPPGEFGTLLGGLHSVPALITHAGAQSGIQVALRPLGARALLGLPAGELAALDLPAEAVLGGVCAELRDRVRAAAGWPERFAVLDEILLRRAAGRATWRRGPAAASPGGQLGLARAAAGGRRAAGVRAGRRDRLERAPPDQPVPRRDRADAEGRRPRHQVRPGQEAAGAQAADAAADGGYLLADLAADCGYFDQAHLAREFRALAGCPPSQWLAEEFRNVQAGNWLDDEAWEPGRSAARLQTAKGGTPCHPHRNRRSGPRCGRATPGR